MASVRRGSRERSAVMSSFTSRGWESDRTCLLDYEPPPQRELNRGPVRALRDRHHDPFTQNDTHDGHPATRASEGQRRARPTRRRRLAQSQVSEDQCVVATGVYRLVEHCHNRAGEDELLGRPERVEPPLETLCRRVGRD